MFLLLFFVATAFYHIHQKYTNHSTMTVKLPFKINAGLLDYNPSDQTVRPLYTKGLLTISKADSLNEDDDGMDILNFKWEPLDTGSGGDHLEAVEKVLFPGEQIIVPYTHLKSSRQFPNSLIYLLTFSSGEVVPLYIQEQDTGCKADTYELNKDCHKGDGFRSTLTSMNDELMMIFTSIIKGDYE